jgi:MFS family permease
MARCLFAFAVHAPVDRSPSPLTIALTGALCLATLMGVGRFAYTPMLPLMLADGSVGLAAGSALASLNYLGYLAGALACAAGLTRWLQQAADRLRKPSQGVPEGRLGGQTPAQHDVPSDTVVLGVMLVATAVLTAAMALPWAAGWTAWRLLAGLVSAVGFVLSTQWCLTRLAQQGRTALGGLMYTGPGFGIAAGGLLGGAMASLQAPAWVAWLVFGALALALSARAWRTLATGGNRVEPTPTGTAGTVSTTDAAAPARMVEAKADRLSLWGLTLAYGLAGFGYIIPATFLPVMARAWLGAGTEGGATGAALLADLFWPLFGLGIVVGATLASRVRESLDVRAPLLACYLVQAAGVALAVWRPDVAGLALGSLLLGLPFTAITFFAMREVRRLRPHSATRWIGLTTAAYGIGQIAGPPVAAWLVALTGQAAAGFTVSMHLATATLLIGAAIFAWLLIARPR